MPPPPISLKITNLQLRPESISTLLRRGFTTTSEIALSKKKGGISNFAAELGCPLSDAASISREVDLALASGSSEKLSTNNNDTKNNTVSTDKGYRNTSNLNSFLNPNNENNKTNDNNCGTGISAAHLLMQQKSRSTRPIVTFCKSVDSLLGGGFATSEVTEIVGVPGVGKTQMAMQLCVDARLPKEHGGVEGEAVYIDSEGSFSPERCYSMAASLVDHVHLSAQRRMDNYRQEMSNTVATTHCRNMMEQPQPPLRVPDSFNKENILNGIHVFRVHDEAAQMATIQSLYNFLTLRKRVGLPVKVVILDSIAFHYRSISSKTNFAERTRSLTSIAATLSDISNKFELAVVVINHMTTKVEKNSNNNSNVHSHNHNPTFGSIINNEIIENGIKLTPALGESWAHAITTRIILTNENTLHGTYITSTQSNNDNNNISDHPNVLRRRFTLVKSPHKPAGYAFYCVLEVGIRDCPNYVSITDEKIPSMRNTALEGSHNNLSPMNSIKTSQNQYHHGTLLNSTKRPRYSN